MSQNFKKGISQALYEKAKRIIPGGTQLFSKRPEMFLPEYWPAYYKRALGCKIWGMDETEYVDVSYMGLGACVLGYADPVVNNAVIQAVESGSLTTLNCPEEVELGMLLCEIHPWASKVRYARTGGEAMSIAVRIARAYSKKEIILFCGYHGWHDWYLASNINNKTALNGHLINDLKTAGVPSNLKGTAFPFMYNDIEAFLALEKKYRGKIAAVVMEPVRSFLPQNDFLKVIRDVTKKNNELLVFDEITSGFRLCPSGAHLVFDVIPDIAVFGKAIGNGFPMSAIIGKSQVMEAAQETFISSTFWSEKIGLVSALTTINEMIHKCVCKHLKKTGSKIQNGWKKLAKKNNLNIHVYGIEPLSKFSFEHKDPLVLKTLFTQKMLEMGFLATTAFYVSYAHTNSYVEKYLDAVDETFHFLSNIINETNLEKYLLGSVCHSDFKRIS